MGCGGSKPEAEAEETPAKRVQSGIGPSKPPSRAPSRPQSRHVPRPPSHAGSASRPHSRSGSSSRPGSRQGSTSRPTSRQGPRKHHDNARNRRSVLVQPIAEDQLAEDVAIVSDISALSTLIEQHARNFYNHSGGEDLRARRAIIRQRIAQAIIEDVIMGRGRGRLFYAQKGLSASGDLLAYLQSFAREGSSDERNEHLGELCKRGASISRYIQPHPAVWEFGDWHDESGATVVFPSLLKDGVKVRPRDAVTL